MKTALLAAIVLQLAALGLAPGAFAQAQPAAPAAAQAVAPSASGQATPQPPVSPMAQFVPIILMFGVVYFLMIRPQQKKMKEQQEMIKALQHGDEIITSSGMLGRITGLAEKVVTVEIADNVRVKLLRSQVAQVVKGQIQDIAQ